MQCMQQDLLSVVVKDGGCVDALGGSKTISALILPYEAFSSSPWLMMEGGHRATGCSEGSSARRRYAAAFVSGGGRQWVRDASATPLS